MKFKEIIKNKWGWVGAVDGALLFTYNFVAIKIVQTGIFGNDNYLALMIVSAVTGFIAGLILQKLWRKVK